MAETLPEFIDGGLKILADEKSGGFLLNDEQKGFSARFEEVLSFLSDQKMGDKIPLEIDTSALSVSHLLDLSRRITQQYFSKKCVFPSYVHQFQESLSGRCFSNEEVFAILQKLEIVDNLAVRSGFLFFLSNSKVQFPEDARRIWLRSKRERPELVYKEMYDAVLKYDSKDGDEVAHNVAECVAVLFLQKPADQLWREVGMVVRKAFDTKFSGRLTFLLRPGVIKSRFADQVETFLCDFFGESMGGHFSAVVSDVVKEQDAAFLQKFSQESDCANNCRAYLLEQVQKYNSYNSKLESGRLLQTQIIQDIIGKGIPLIQTAEDLREALLILREFPFMQKEIAQKIRSVGSKDVFRNLLFSLSCLQGEERATIADFVREHFLSSKDHQAVLQDFLQNDTIFVASETLDFLLDYGDLGKMLTVGDVLLGNVKSLSKDDFTRLFVLRRVISCLSQKDRLRILAASGESIMNLQPKVFEYALRTMGMIFSGTTFETPLDDILEKFRDTYKETCAARVAARQEKRRNSGVAADFSSEEADLDEGGMWLNPFNSIFEKKISHFSVSPEHLSSTLVTAYGDIIQRELKDALWFFINEGIVQETLSVDISGDSLMGHLGVNRADFVPIDGGFDVMLSLGDDKFCDIKVLLDGKVVFPEGGFVPCVRDILQCEISRVLYEQINELLECTSNVDYRTMFLGMMGFRVEVEFEVESQESEFVESFLQAPPLELGPDGQPLAPEEIRYRDFRRRNYQVFVDLAHLLEERGVRWSGSGINLNNILQCLGQQSAREHVQKIVPSGGIEIVNRFDVLTEDIPSVDVHNPRDNQLFLQETCALDFQTVASFQDSHLCVLNVTLYGKDRQLFACVSPGNRWVSILGLEGADLEEGMSDFRLRLIKELKYIILRALLCAITREDYKGKTRPSGVPTGWKPDTGKVRRTFTGTFSPSKPALIVEPKNSPEDDEKGAHGGLVGDEIEDLRGLIARNFLYDPKNVFWSLVTDPCDVNADKLYSRGLYLSGDLFRKIFDCAAFENLPDEEAARILAPVFEREQIERIDALVFTPAVVFQEMRLNETSDDLSKSVFERGVFEGKISLSPDIRDKIFKGGVSILSSFVQDVQRRCREQFFSCNEREILRALCTLSCLNSDTVSLGGLGEAHTYRLPFIFPRDTSVLASCPHIDDVPKFHDGLVHIVQGKGVKFRDNFGIFQKTRSPAMTLAGNVRNAAYHLNSSSGPLLDLRPVIQAVLVFENEDGRFTEIHVVNSKSSHVPKSREGLSPELKSIMMDPILEAEIERCKKENHSKSFEGFDDPDPSTNTRFSRRDIQRMQKEGFWSVPIKRSFIVIFEGAQVGVRQFWQNPLYRQFLDWAYAEDGVLEKDWDGLGSYDPKMAVIQSEIYQVLGENYLRPVIHSTSSSTRAGMY